MSTTTSEARTIFYQYRKVQQCFLLQIRKKTYYILPDQTAQSDQCFPAREYAISVTCFAAHFTSIKDTRAPRGSFFTLRFNKYCRFESFTKAFARLGTWVLLPNPDDTTAPLPHTTHCTSLGLRHLSHLDPQSGTVSSQTSAVVHDALGQLSPPRSFQW